MATIKVQIKRGDRLDLLAKRYLGDQQLWKQIRQKNGLTMPFGPQLKQGQIIEIQI